MFSGVPCNAWEPEVLCGGAVICPRFVMTAAHCQERFDGIKLYVLGGIYNLLSFAWRRNQLKSVKKFHKHPFYRNFHDYDFGIVEVENAFELGNFRGSSGAATPDNPGMLALFLPEPEDDQRYEQAGFSFVNTSLWHKLQQCHHTRCPIFS